MDEIVVTARVKAFSRQGVREHRLLISGDTVRVWDPVAGYFTTVHSLSERAISNLRRAHG